MGLHHRFITVLKSLYHNSYVEVYVNGLKTKKVWIRSGVKQGCPLSPLLWALFICDIGQFLEKSKTGTLIYGVIISALFFVDDLVLIGKTLSEIEKIIKICNDQFLLNGLEINCSKSKVLTKEKVQTDHFDLHNYCSTFLRDFELQECYKYLGIKMNLPLGKPGIYSDQIRYIKNRLNSYKGKILALANNSFDKIKVGCALWQNVAIPAILYGVEILKLKSEDLTKLDSIQAEFIASLLGVSKSCSHVGLLKELNWVPISSYIMKMKLKYWVRLCSLPEQSWAKKAWMECSAAINETKGAWKSDYREEIKNIHDLVKVGHIMKDNMSPTRNVVKAVALYTEDQMESELSLHKQHSLRYLPDFPTTGIQAYLDGSDSSITLTKFRMGNARLGNRDNPRILICPACNNGPNNELHLAFECKAMSDLRKEPWMAKVLDQASHQKGLDPKDPEKLKSFLGGDLASKKVLLERGTYLSILLQKHFEIKQSI